MGFGYQRKRSGNSPVEPGPQPDSVLAMKNRGWTDMVGFMETATVGHIGLPQSSAMRGDCLTCTEMFGSGVGTHLGARTGCTGAVAGTTLLASVSVGVPPLESA